MIFTLEDYTSGKINAGTYTFNYEVTTGSTDPDLTKPFSFTLTLEDPCMTATVQRPEFKWFQEYTISDVDQHFNFADDFKR